MEHNAQWGMPGNNSEEDLPYDEDFDADGYWRRLFAEQEREMTTTVTRRTTSIDEACTRLLQGLLPELLLLRGVQRRSSTQQLSTLQAAQPRPRANPVQVPRPHLGPYAPYTTAFARWPPPPPPRPTLPKQFCHGEPI